MTHDICNIFLAPTRDPHYYQMSLCLMSYISFVYIHCNIKGTESVRQGPCHHGFSQTCQCSKKNSPTHQFFGKYQKKSGNLHISNQVRPNSRSAEFRTSVVSNHSCYVVLGLNWPRRYKCFFCSQD